MLRSALEFDASGQVHEALARLLIDAKRYSDAQSVLLEKARVDSACALLYGRSVLALNEIQRLVRAVEDDQIRPDVVVRLADELQKARKDDAALQLLESLRNRSGEVATLTAQVQERRDRLDLVAKADQLWTSGEFEQSEALLREAAEADLKAIAHLSEILAVTGRLNEGLDLLVSRLEEYPKLIFTLAELCYLHSSWHAVDGIIDKLSLTRFDAVFLLLMKDRGPTKTKAARERLRISAAPQWTTGLGRSLAEAAQGKLQDAIQASEICERSGYGLLAEQLLSPHIGTNRTAAFRYSTMLRNRLAFSAAVKCLGSSPYVTAPAAVAAAMAAYLDGRPMLADSYIQTCRSPAPFLESVGGRLATALSDAPEAVSLSEVLESARHEAAAYDVLLPHRFSRIAAVNERLVRLSDRLSARNKMAIDRYRNRVLVEASWRARTTASHDEKTALLELLRRFTGFSVP